MSTTALRLGLETGEASILPHASGLVVTEPAQIMSGSMDTTSGWKEHQRNILAICNLS